METKTNVSRSTGNWGVCSKHGYATSMQRLVDLRASRRMRGITVDTATVEENEVVEDLISFITSESGVTRSELCLLADLREIGMFEYLREVMVELHDSILNLRLENPNNLGKSVSVKIKNFEIGIAFLNSEY